MSERAPLPQRERSWIAIAREAARGSRARDTAPDGQRLLVFALDGAPYALPVERIREIVGQRPITRVPRMPAEVLGVISLRGQVIQVIDPRARLALAPARPGTRSRIIVAHDGEGRVAGILVDAVEEVVTVDGDGLRDARSGQASAVEGLYRHRGRFVSIVDLDRVMDVDAAA